MKHVLQLEFDVDHDSKLPIPKYVGRLVLGPYIGRLVMDPLTGGLKLAIDERAVSEGHIVVTKSESLVLTG